MLVTPVILRVAPRKPYLYATGHLANSASLLLPISNLTNLLALHDGHIGFGRFALLMAPATVAVIAVEWFVLRRAFSDELSATVTPAPHVDPRARRPALGPRALVRAAQPDFLVFVFALGVIVRAAGHHGLDSAAHSVLPLGGPLPDLLAIAGVSAGARQRGQQPAGDPHPRADRRSTASTRRCVSSSSWAR